MIGQLHVTHELLIEGGTHRGGCNSKTNEFKDTDEHS